MAQRFRGFKRLRCPNCKQHEVMTEPEFYGWCYTCETQVLKNSEKAPVTL